MPAIDCSVLIFLHGTVNPACALPSGAPHAQKVSVVGDFNHWDDDANPMERSSQGNGIWVAYIEGCKKGHL